MKPAHFTLLLSLFTLLLLTTGCSDTRAYPSPDNAFENQWDERTRVEFIRAQGGIPREEWATEWLTVYNRGAIDQAITQIKGDPYITLEGDEHGKVTALRKMPIESYPAPTPPPMTPEQEEQAKRMEEKGQSELKKLDAKKGTKG